ncbi:hypothetical protein [Salmonirosea aquatica]|uniref:Uncharacterized protein n=1 Tax=Salmonirosea aquatica TaxID=2654236 RepID=A0A7C9FQI1_9BACT|nr:hypothetical protein [Cytophagaceae bacterium SJW1-29]
MSYVNQLSNQHHMWAEAVEDLNEAILTLKEEYLVSDSPEIYDPLRVSRHSERARDYIGILIGSFLKSEYRKENIFGKLDTNVLSDLQKKLSNQEGLDLKDLNALDLFLFLVAEKRSELSQELRMSRF